MPDSPGPNGPIIDRRGFVAAASAAAVAWIASGCTDRSASVSPTTNASSTNENPATTASEESVPDAAASESTTGTSEPQPDSSPVPLAERALMTDDFVSIATCMLMPAMPAGPFPNPEILERHDISEGLSGWPLRLGLRIVDASCEPVPGVAVDVWHADATGDYSAYEDRGTGKDEGAGTTFLRGTQIADDRGIVEFRTIYPGWYPGRAVHVHLTVRGDEGGLLTSQLFLPDDLTDRVVASPAYVEFGEPDTRNADDVLGGDIDTNGSLLTVPDETVTDQDSPMVALVNLGLSA